MVSCGYHKNNAAIIRIAIHQGKATRFCIAYGLAKTHKHPYNCCYVRFCSGDEIYGRNHMTRKVVVFLVLCMLAATLAGCGTKSTGGVDTSDMAADQTVRYNLAVEPGSLCLLYTSDAADDLL